jgi:hypothetical protein
MTEAVEAFGLTRIIRNGTKALGGVDLTAQKGQLLQ